MALAALLGLAVLSASACGSSPSGTSPSSSAPAGSTTTTSPAATPPAAASALSSALTRAYQSETGALATYKNVVSALGSVGPFPNIVEAEQQHVGTISALFGRYNLTVPATAAGQTSPGTLSAACTLGVTIEQQIIAFYNQQLPAVSGYPDVTTAFQNLKAAAQDSHLPAFQRCA